MWWFDRMDASNFAAPLPNKALQLTSDSMTARCTRFIDSLAAERYALASPCRDEI
jgi:hypothetical protein